jgi:hypothetical protein
VQQTSTTGTDTSNLSGFANLRWLDVVGGTRLDTSVTVASARSR